jgi:hypothetical protein
LQEEQQISIDQLQKFNRIKNIYIPSIFIVQCAQVSCFDNCKGDCLKIAILSDLIEKKFINLNGSMVRTWHSNMSALA